MVSQESCVETEYAKIWVKDKILFLTYKKEYINIAYAKSVVESRLKVSNGQTYPVFVDLNLVKGADKDARKYLAEGKACSLIAASALWGINEVIGMIANFYLRVDKPDVPVKFFQNNQKARQWLALYKKC